MTCYPYRNLCSIPGWLLVHWARLARRQCLASWLCCKEAWFNGARTRSTLRRGPRIYRQLFAYGTFSKHSSKQCADRRRTISEVMLNKRDLLEQWLRTLNDFEACPSNDFERLVAAEHITSVNLNGMLRNSSDGAVLQHARRWERSAD